ncbi:hypothetical protein PMKS-001969 [Pichia membranifaciens]|uniref:Uncharacterized protein n=1 Tax=Pichia membranifaciens TaxID=4926 RepID=A0A1Q2YG53_9ASCO|nr:hypothetical protein PMKS-001969 [Pichia membranifaciens]
MRLPKSVLLRRPDLAEETNDSEPATAKDFYDEGVNYEESGDRWFTSDLSKAIRFYHRAHESYKQALKLDPVMMHALYNLPRLEYEVYNKYTKDDSVVMDDLSNCADALNDTKAGGLFQDIVSLCRTFESSIDILIQSGNESSMGWDFYFNSASCYFEYIETLCSDPSILQDLSEKSELVKAVQRCIYMFEKVLSYMNDTLENNVEDESVNPEAVSSVCIESYRMLSVVYETLYTPELIGFMDNFTAGYLDRVDSVSNKLVQDPIPNDIILTLKIAKLSQRASRQLDYDPFVGIWTSEPELNDTIEKQLTQSSSVRSFLDKFETVEISVPDEAKWLILTNLDSTYRAINAILCSQIDELAKTNNSENDLLSGKISLACSVFIERADIFLERSFLKVNEAVKNRIVLRNNCKNLLRNALIFSKKTGGIRESIIGKLTRKKRQREAAMRLCLIEGKAQEEWGKIIGENYWPQELQALADIEGYKMLLN